MAMAMWHYFVRRKPMAEWEQTYSTKDEVVFFWKESTETSENPDTWENPETRKPL